MSGEMLVQKTPPFLSRSLVIASADLLKALNHSGFDALLLEWDLPEGVGQGSGLAARATSLARYALSDPDLRTADGRSLQSEIVRRAGEIYRDRLTPNIGDKERLAFKNASANAGSLNDVSEMGVEIVSTTGDFVPRSVLAESRPSEAVQSKSANRKVFIVHGHDEGARESVARFLEKIDFEVVILHEQANRGRTVIEKVEAHGDVSFAVVLLTPDDEGSKIGGTLHQRARQNVILELGYFIGRLGRSNVCALTKESVEIPSDFAGVVYEPLEGPWRNALARELEDAGFEIDWKKVSRP